MAASTVIEQVKDILYSLSDSFLSLSPDQQWRKEEVTSPSTCDGWKTATLQVDAVLNLVNEAKQLLQKESTLLSLASPIVVVGDIHGQFCDLVRLFHYTFSQDMITRNQQPLTRPPPDISQQATPILPTLVDGYYRFDPHQRSGLESLKLPCADGQEHSYLFLGDYVDRGSYSTECVLFLLSLKVIYPSRIFLLRGNHESRSMTQMSYSEGMNFKEECELKYGEAVYDTIMKCLDSLPLAAVVKNNLGKWLCCHAGIGSKTVNLDSIEKLERHQEPPMNGPICDLLWADPLSEDVLGTRLTDKDYGEFMELDYLPNPGRGCSCLYGYAAISQVLSNNDLLGIIRGHQCKEEGISFAYSNNRKILFPFPLVTTVFSAANYCGTYTNKGAVLVILNDELQVIKYTSSGETWVEDTPYCPPETETIPEIPEIITEESPETEDQPMPLLPEDEFRLRSGAIKKDSIGSRRRPNQRSLSISHHVSVPVKVSKRSTLRRKSMHMIKQGGTIEEGSEKFLSALKQDALHELHPGWNSVRRLAGVVGKVQMIRKREQSDSDPNITANNEQPKLRKSISKSLLDKVGKNDATQLKLAFDSIDRNGDGVLSIQELEEFALQLGVVHAVSDDVRSELHKLLVEMDENNDGSVSFEEFAQYLTALSLLEEQKIWGGLATTHETIPELEQTSRITPKILNN